MSEEQQAKQSPDQPSSVNESNQIAEVFTRVLNKLLDQKIRENIRSVYCNNTQFQNGEMDFTILFGQINQNPGGGKTAIDWNTAVTMAWAQAKLLSYYMRANLVIYEALHGIVKVPAATLPGTIVAPDDLETNPLSKKIFEAVNQLHREFIDEQLGRTPVTQEP
jgi:hypothetical protein